MNSCRFSMPCIVFGCLLTSSVAYCGNQDSRSSVKSAMDFAPAASPSVLSGLITDIVTGKPLSGLLVSSGECGTKTDSQGQYTLKGLPAGTRRMEVTGDGIIPRNLMVKHQGVACLDVTVKSSTFNNAMFWASASHNEHIMRWRHPPKWVIYNYILDSEPPEPLPGDARAYLRGIIEHELPEISPFFAKPHVEVFDGRPNDDARWTGEGNRVGYILCAPARKGAGRAAWKARDRWVRYAKVTNNYVRAPKVWRHEIAHALGMGHAVRDKKWLPLGRKDPNYRPTKLADPVEKYTDWDKTWLRCVYSGSRPAGNEPPDRDPDHYIHSSAPRED